MVGRLGNAAEDLGDEGLDGVGVGFDGGDVECARPHGAVDGHGGDVDGR